MFHNGRSSIFPIVFILIASTLALVFSCSDQPTAIDNKSGDGLAGKGEIDPGASGSFLLGEVSDSSIGPGTLEVWAMNVAFNETTGIASFDVQLLNRTRRTVAPPIRFVITSVAPPDIATVDFDGVSRDGFPFYDFGAKLGDDNLLTPGERTDRVTMKFHTVTARSFAIGFRIDIGPPDGTGTLGGVVFLDANGNGERDRSCRCEPGIPGITVALERTLGNGDRVTLLTRTDANGEYRFAGNREGVHKVFVGAPEDPWKITSANPLLVTLVKNADGEGPRLSRGEFRSLPPAPRDDSLWTDRDRHICDLWERWKSIRRSSIRRRCSPWSLSIISSVNGCRRVCPARSIRPRPGSTAKWSSSMCARCPDTFCFAPQTIEIRDGLVKEGRNTIRLLMDADRVGRARVAGIQEAVREPRGKYEKRLWSRARKDAAPSA